MGKMIDPKKLFRMTAQEITYWFYLPDHRRVVPTQYWLDFMQIESNNDRALAIAQDPVFQDIAKQNCWKITVCGTDMPSLDDIDSFSYKIIDMYNLSHHGTGSADTGMDCSVTETNISLKPSCLAPYQLMTS